MTIRALSHHSLGAKIIISLLLLPLLYFSGVRLVSQWIVPTDDSSLWANPLPHTLYSKETLPSVVNRLTALDPLSASYATLLTQLLITIDSSDLVRSVRNAIRVSAVNPDAWAVFGKLQGMQGKADESLATFERAISLNPGRPDTYLETGLSLFDMLPSLPADRKPLYRNLAELNLNLSLSLDHALSRNPHLLLALATMAKDKGSEKAAAFYLKRIVLSPPVDWSFVIKKLALCMSLGEIVEAVSLWKTVFDPKSLTADDMVRLETELAAHQNRDFAYFLAKIHSVQGKHKQTLEELKSLVSRKGQIPEYKMALASAYENASEYKQAMQLYEEVLRLSPANQEAKRKVAEYYAGRRS